MRGYGMATEQVGGLPSITGYLGAPPHRAAGYTADGISAVYAASAVLAALNYRRQTGKGQFIDLAQAETVTCTMGEAVMDYSMNKRVTKPMGNRHPSYTPYGCYRCQGDDMWVTIAVTSDEEWHSFCAAIGNSGWTEDDKFSDMLGRWKNQDELDKLIEGWTIQHDHYAVQEILQNAGVAAGAVVSLEEQILYDPQIKDRETYQYIKYPPDRNWAQGRLDPVFRVPWVMSKTPTSLTKPAPYAGRDNQYVFGQILGMSKEEIAKLTEEGILGSNPP
jgi:benzylsuccinate CoA-transferase BbsF subunit